MFIICSHACVQHVSLKYSEIIYYHLLVSSAAGNDPISVKSSLSSVGVVDADNELTVIGNNDVFEDEALLIGDCKSSVCVCVCLRMWVHVCMRTCTSMYYYYSIL